MLASADPAFGSLVTGLLWFVGAVYALGAVLLVARAFAARDTLPALSRLAGLVNLAPALVGLACLALAIDAASAGLRPGHESEFLDSLARPLPTVAILSSAAGFLAGLLGTARPRRTALAVGGPVTLLTVLTAGALVGVMTIAWPGAKGVADGIWSQRAAFARSFGCLALFPASTLGLTWAAAVSGRRLLGWLGLEGPEAEPTGAAPVSPAGPPAPFLFPPPPAWAAPPPTSGTPRPGERPLPAWRTVKTDRRGTWPRIALVAFGALLLATASRDVRLPRPRLLRSSPAAGAVLTTPPPVVELVFSEALDAWPELKVARTVTIDGSRGQVATGGTFVARVSGSEALGPDGRSVRVRLPAGAGGGLYAVDWSVASARATRAQRFGSLYFAVGLPVPDFIVREGVSREEDSGERDRREALLGGVLCIAIGLAWSVLLKARTARAG